MFETVKSTLWLAHIMLSTYCLIFVLVIIDGKITPLSVGLALYGVIGFATNLVVFFRK